MLTSATAHCLDNKVPEEEEEEPSIVEREQQQQQQQQHLKLSTSWFGHSLRPQWSQPRSCGGRPSYIGVAPTSRKGLEVASADREVKFGNTSWQLILISHPQNSQTSGLQLLSGDDVETGLCTGLRLLAPL